jgi:hypothetical protein
MTGGCQILDWNLAAIYTSGDENRYFGWEDCHGDTARQLATKFVVRFPTICARGKGADWPYAGWYVHVLGIAEQGALPDALSEYFNAITAGYLETITAGAFGPANHETLPLPPP